MQRSKDRSLVSLDSSYMSRCKANPVIQQIKSGARVTQKEF